ncbi:MAG TPA: nitroreductase family protein [Polyangiaceae bacterium]
MSDPGISLAPHIERILEAARLAPSHDNWQPWRFVVEGETISFLVDHERDRSPANAGGRSARMAVGASLECALLRAARMGATVRFETPRPNALVTITVTSPKRTPEPDKALVGRATNRRLYDGRPLDDATFAWLQAATPPLDGTRTHWFGRERVRVLGPILEEGEARFFGDPHLREAALRAVHFDVRDREEVSHGLSLGCLELSTSERLTFDALRHTPQDRLAALGAFKKMGARAQRLVESASGVCVIATQGSEPASDVAVGRCMQRAWLALTRRGLVAHPMMSIPALETILELGDQAGTQLAERERTGALVASLRAAFPNVERGSRIAFLMRVGWAPPPTTRVRRLPLEESVGGALDGPLPT